MTDELDQLLAADASGSGQSDGGKLRKQLEDVLAQNKALQEKFEVVQAAERARSLEGLFAKHQIPELARDFFPQDAQPTDEAATEFASKYGQLWGSASATATTPPAQQAQANAMQQFSTQSAPPPGDALSEDDYAAKFAEAGTRDELLKMLAEYGSAITG